MNTRKRLLKSLAMLAICILLPIFSLSENSIKASESTISYLDVPELKAGENKITQDNQTVEYIDSYGDLQTFYGQVFQYTAPESGHSALHMTLSDDNYDISDIEGDYYLQNDNGMLSKEGTYIMSNNSVVINFDAGCTYYLVINVSSYQYGDETPASAMQDISLYIANDIPELASKIDDVESLSENKSYIVSDDDLDLIYTDVFYEVRNVKAYKIELPADSRLPVNCKYYDGYYISGILYAERYCYSEYENKYYTDSDGLITIGDETYLYNDSDTTMTYFIITSIKNITITTGSIQTLPAATPILDAEIPEISLNSESIQYTLNYTNTQRCSYSLLGDTEKTEGVWFKFTIPENESYEYYFLYNGENESGSWTECILKQYSDDANDFESYGSSVAQYYTKDNSEPGISSLPKGTYYMCLTGTESDFPATVYFNRLEKIESLKEQAILLLDTDFEHGSLVVTSSEKQYSYSETESLTSRWGSYGNLMKVQIPSGTGYQIYSNSFLSSRLYDETFTSFINADSTESLFIENKSNETKTYYIWFCTFESCTEHTIKLKKYETDICSHTNTEIRNAKTTSCYEEGYTGDKYCLDCDELLEKGTAIAKSSHTESDWIVDKAATTEVAGSMHKQCTVCGEVLATEEIAKLEAETPTVTTRYTTHVQTYGWQGDENNTNKWFTNGKMAGTSGKAKRLEGIKIKVFGNDNLGIQYTTHCQSYGWLPWSANGEMNGTEGEAKRLEAIKIQLTGADKDKYDVYYRVHAQSYGWLGWVKNGAPSGTAGYAKRLEGIQIVVVKKGEAAPGLNYGGVNAAATTHQSAGYIAKSGSSPVVGSTATSNTNPQVAGASNVNISYRTHVQSYGWQGWKYNGQMSGTSGQAKRLEGINIKLTNKPYSGSVVYTTHVQSYGWQGNENNEATWKKDGQMSGTSGQAKRLEAIRIDLTGEMAEHYDIYYRVHAQSYGWLNWAKNGEAAGTAGLAKRLEGIQIVLVPKGGKAPAKTYNGVTSVRTQAYIKK